MIVFNVNEPRPKLEVQLRRDWRKYSKELLCEELIIVNWKSNISDVQGFWNEFENKLVQVIDKIVPLTPFVNNMIKEPIPGVIKNKINIRNRLLKKRKTNATPELKSRIANLYVLNRAIPLDWLNDSLSTYKIKCKKLMLM